MQDLRQLQQLLALTLDELRDRNARPAGHDLRDFLFRHTVAEQAVGALVLLDALFLLGQFGS